MEIGSHDYGGRDMPSGNWSTKKTSGIIQSKSEGPRLNSILETNIILYVP